MNERMKWQDQGGKFEIPDGWFVCHADFDCEVPFISITKGSVTDGKKVHVPKSLAYYLSVHFCGSKIMHELIEKNAIDRVQQKIKDAIGL